MLSSALEEETFKRPALSRLSKSSCAISYCYAVTPKREPILPITVPLALHITSDYVQPSAGGRKCFISSPMFLRHQYYHFSHNHGLRCRYMQNQYNSGPGTLNNAESMPPHHHSCRFITSSSTHPCMPPNKMPAPYPKSALAPSPKLSMPSI